GAGNGQWTVHAQRVAAPRRRARLSEVRVGESRGLSRRTRERERQVPRVLTRQRGLRLRERPAAQREAAQGARADEMPDVQWRDAAALAEDERQARAALLSALSRLSGRALVRRA